MCLVYDNIYLIFLECSKYKASFNCCDIILKLSSGLQWISPGDPASGRVKCRVSSRVDRTNLSDERSGPARKLIFSINKSNRQIGGYDTGVSEGMSGGDLYPSRGNANPREKEPVYNRAVTYAPVPPDGAQ